MSIFNFKTLIESHTGLKSYPEFVPSEVELPALAYSLITSRKADRTLKLKPAGTKTTYRVNVIANNPVERATLREQLESLDGAISTGGFKTILLSYSGDRPASETDLTFTSIVDFETTS